MKHLNMNQTKVARFVQALFKSSPSPVTVGVPNASVYGHACVKPDSWVNLAVVYSNGSPKTYMDGSLVGHVDGLTIKPWGLYKSRIIYKGHHIHDLPEDHTLSFYVKDVGWDPLTPGAIRILSLVQKPNLYPHQMMMQKFLKGKTPFAQLAY